MTFTYDSVNSKIRGEYIIRRIFKGTIKKHFLLKSINFHDKHALEE